MEAVLFSRLGAIAGARAGLTIDESRRALVSARVEQRVRALGLRDVAEYLRLLETDRSGEEFVCLLEAISGRSPRFFRHGGHFDDLAAAVLAWYAAGQRRFRFWSAACATGEEPYSVAIAVLEALDGRDADVRVLGTDPSSRNLKIASEGVYEEPATSGLSPNVRRRYLVPVGGGPKDGGLHRVDPALRDLVVFKRLPLSATPYPMRGPLDAIFCRDVLTYLEPPVRTHVVSEIDRLLRPDGLLFLGPMETLTVAREAIVPVRTSVYRREVAGDSPVRPTV